MADPKPISGAGVKVTPSVTATSVEQKKRTSQMSKEERLAYAQAHGLKGDRASTYANLDRTNPYQNTFWDRFRRFFGGKLGSESMQEYLDLDDQAFLNELLAAQREEEYNSPEQQAARERAAGINPDLDPGSIAAGEASQIDDEVLGSGLKDQLSAMNNEPGNFQSMASILMDGATSVLGLLSGGAGLAQSIMSMDSSSISDLLNFSKFISELTFDPTSPEYKQYVGEDGEIHFDRIGWDKFPLFSPRYRKVFTGMKRGLNSPENKARRAEAARRYSTSQVGIASDYESLRSRSPQLVASIFGNKSDEELYPFHLNAINDETYKRYVENVAQFTIDKLKGDVKAAEINRKYQEALATGDFGSRKAAYEQSSQELSKLRSDLQLQAGKRVKSTFDRLIKESQDGSWISTLLLQSIVSGSFNQFGLGSPQDLPFKLVDQVTGIIPKIISGFIPGL